jgi:hypothetical protein
MRQTCSTCLGLKLRSLAAVPVCIDWFPPSFVGDVEWHLHEVQLSVTAEADASEGHRCKIFRLLVHAWFLRWGNHQSGVFMSRLKQDSAAMQT